MAVVKKRVKAKKVVRADSRGRIPLGPKATDKDYIIDYTEDGSISLTPVTYIPEREAWLFKNEEALAQVMAGLADAKAGRVVDGGSFEQYADDEID